MNQNNYDKLVQHVVKTELEAGDSQLILRCTAKIQDHLQGYRLDKKFIKHCVNVCLGVTRKGNGVFICHWRRVGWEGKIPS